MSHREPKSQYWFTFQHELSPWLAEELGPLGERHKRFVEVLEFVRVEDVLLGEKVGGPGRPLGSWLRWPGRFCPRPCSTCP